MKLFIVINAAIHAFLIFLSLQKKDGHITTIDIIEIDVTASIVMLFSSSSINDEIQIYYRSLNAVVMVRLELTRDIPTFQLPIHVVLPFVTPGYYLKVLHLPIYSQVLLLTSR